MRKITSVAPYSSIFAGLALGGASLFMTYHLRSLLIMDPNLVARALKAAAFALVVPGLLAALVTSGAFRAFPTWAMAAVNFAFWFGFAWLFATFIEKLLKLRRAIAAVR